jgi:DNA-directed RNA polymerase specialized sigma24 family protein
MRAAAHNRADLVRGYYARVLGIAYQVVGDATLASRATSAIFRRTLRLRPTAGQETVALWRTALKILRGYRARGLTVAPLTSESGDWQTTLLSRLGRLEADDRILLLLRYREGLDDQQLAEVLDADRHAVRARLAQARNRLLAEQT